MTAPLSGARAMRTSAAIAQPTSPSGPWRIQGAQHHRAACTAFFDRWVFSTAGLVSFAGWNLLIAVCSLLIAVALGRKYSKDRMSDFTQRECLFYVFCDRKVFPNRNGKKCLLLPKVYVEAARVREFQECSLH